MEKNLLGAGDVKPFIKSMLGNDYFRSSFPKLPIGNKINILFQYLVGTQTERFAAEPVYSKTGVGKLVSRGVQGVVDDDKLLAILASNEGKKTVRKFSRMVAMELEGHER